jgi:Spy/CpxP family protein refolding chaperone
MIMLRRILSAACLVLLVATAATAQDRRKWWADEQSRKEIGLTEEQAAKAEEVYQASLPRMQDLKRQLDALEGELSALIRDSRADEVVVAAKIDAVERVRSEMNKARVLMLYRIHRLLTPEQHEKFRALVERWNARRKGGEHGR